VIVSSLAGRILRGDHDSIGAGPRTTNGVTGPTANTLPPFGLTRSPGASPTSKRLSHPVRVVPGFSTPLSSTSWPSKCERSR
jgi:hypothetical protein